MGSSRRSPLATRLGISADVILEHVQWCCSKVRILGLPLRIARECYSFQSLVTVNPDACSERVLPAQQLDETFDPIVASWREGPLGRGSAGALRRVGGRR